MIHIKNFSLILPYKTCFEGFSTIVYPNERVAVIGDNGCGKSSLLKMILEIEPQAAYVPQIIDKHTSSSGGESFNQMLSNEMSKQPEILLLDEPTNHLDAKNRKTLMRMLCHFHGVVIAATHDVELLELF